MSKKVHSKSFLKNKHCNYGKVITNFLWKYSIACSFPPTSEYRSTYEVFRFWLNDKLSKHAEYKIGKFNMILHVQTLVLRYKYK